MSRSAMLHNGQTRGAHTIGTGGLAVKRLRFVLAFAFIFAFSAVGVGLAAAKVGVLNADAVMERSVAGQEAQAILADVVAERQQILQEKEDELNELAASAQDGTERSPEEAAALADSMDSLRAELTALVRQFENEIDEIVDELQGQILSSVQYIAALLAEELGYDLILDGSHVAFASESIDITDELVRRYDAMLAERRAAEEDD